MKLSIQHFFNKCDQICSFLQIWSHLLKKSFMESFIFCTVWEPPTTIQTVKKAPSPTPSTQRNYAMSKIFNLLLYFQPLKLIKKHPLYQLKTFFQWKTTLKSFQYLRRRKIDHIDHKLIEDPAKICKPCVPAHSILLISVPRCLKK